MKIARSHGLGNQPPSMHCGCRGNDEPTLETWHSFNNQQSKKLGPYFKRTSKPCKQAKYDRLVVLVICGYMLPASTFGAWTVNLFITEPQYNLVSWESARRVFWETLQNQPRCKHPRFIVIIVIVTIIIINPILDIFNHEIWPQLQKSLTIAHIAWCTVCIAVNALNVGLVSFQVPNEQTCYFFFNLKLMCSRRLCVCLFEENAWRCCFLFMCYYLHYHNVMLVWPKYAHFCRSNIPNSAWYTPCPVSLHTADSINFYWDIQATDWGRKTWPAKAWSRNWSPYPVRMSACNKYVING